MNAPEALPIAHAAELLPLASIVVSQSNPRKRFDKVSMDELTSSVQKHGVLQPVLVRPVTRVNEAFRYELVAGERRFRAATAAGLSAIPAMIRELSDAEALELQVVENLQRADLHPLEEAEGYEQLQKLYGYSADDLAAKVGKSKAYVYARMKLTALCKEARQAFYDGKLNPSTALLIARIPVAKVQVEALKEITALDYNDQPMSYREAVEHLQNAYMLRLKEAVFDIKDASLVAKAGACGPCPKRTGNQPELFGDVKNADVCTDPQCFASKKEAHFARRRKEFEAAGRKVISGAEAKKVAPNEYTMRGYMKPDEELYQLGADDQEADDPNYPTAIEMAKKLGVETELLEMPKTKELVEVVPEGALQAALKKAGLVKPQRLRSSGSGGDTDRVKKAKAETAIRQQILEAVHAAPADKFTRDDFVRIAHAFFNDIWAEYRKLVLRLWGWNELEKTQHRNGVDPVLAGISALSSEDLARFMLDCALVMEVNVGPYDNSKCAELEAAAARRGIDVAAIRAAAKSATKAKKNKKTS